MSTTYNFIDALQMLTEGRCKGIRPESHLLAYVHINEVGTVSWDNGLPLGNLAPSSVLGQWTLVDEKPKLVLWSRPEHVPSAVCWLREMTSTHFEMIISISPDGIETTNHKWRFGQLYDCEYSLNLKDWHACLVEP
jgi:hypothetical protein